MEYIRHNLRCPEHEIRERSNQQVRQHERQLEHRIDYAKNPMIPQDCVI